MTRLTVLYLLPVLLAAVARAREIAIEQRPFTIEKSFVATALPDNGCVLLQIEPKSWADFQIIELAAHGSRVAKGDTLVSFDPETIDKKIADIRLSLDANTLTLAQAELDLKHLQETAPHQLDALRRAAEIAKEENGYFTKTRRKATEETAAHGLERKKQLLSNQQEELRQLTKMYAADDLTEDTEEIILTRQKDAVATAEFMLRMETLDYKRTLEVILPREVVTLADKERDAAICLLKAQEDIPRSIKLHKLELETFKTTCQRDKETLAKLEADRTRFTFKAPADGWFYHGPIENGRWNPAEAVKALVIHGRPVVNRPFATFMPASTKLVLSAFLEEAAARSLKPDIAGTAILAGREDIEISVKIAKIAAAPAPDGTYRADLSVTWPKDFTPIPGTSAQIRMISYHQQAAIAIPTKALAYDPKGWNVEVKLADGKTERRPVKCGRVSKEDIEILSGLEVGQVILTSGDDPKPKS
jgi:multidrug efflux pump subunit AcrA (membrane-fusion protein)